MSSSNMNAYPLRVTQQTPPPSFHWAFLQQQIIMKDLKIGFTITALLTDNVERVVKY